MTTHKQDHSTDKRSTNNQSKSHSGTENRGFASMDIDKQREIAAKGGRASHGGNNKNRKDH